MILVTGGRGRLARAIAKAGGERVRNLGHADLDITDVEAIEAAIATCRPAALINCAAVANVDAASAAFAVNAAAPALLAQACTRTGVPMIHLSTDYVFGAPTDRPWREEDPTSPVNDYGRLKAEGERGAWAAGGRVCVARVAWLFGDGEDFIARLLRGGDTSVSVADDQIGSPTPIHALAARLLDLAERMAAKNPPIPPILHLAGVPPVSRADWVQTAFEAIAGAGGRPPALVRAPMASFPSTAPRPYFSALDCTLAEILFGSPLDWKSVAANPATWTA